MMLMTILKRLVCLRYPTSSHQRALYHSHHRLQGSNFRLPSVARSTLLTSTTTSSASAFHHHPSPPSSPFAAFQLQRRQHSILASYSPSFVLNSSISGHGSSSDHPRKRSGSAKRHNRKKSIQRPRSQRHHNRPSFSTHTTKANMPKRKKGPKVYAVATGRTTGLFPTWAECEAQVKGFPKAIFKSFLTRQEAEVFLRQHDAIPASSAASASFGMDNGNADNDTNSSNKKQKRASESPPRDAVREEPATENDSTSAAAQQSATSSPESPSSSAVPLPPNAHVHKLTFHINFDGGSRGNPKGVAGAGAHVVARTFYTKGDGQKQRQEHVQRTVTDIRKFLGKGSMTNNQAEYLGAIAGLKQVLETLEETSASVSSSSSSFPKDTVIVTILVQGDSNLVVQQLKGNWACKSANMQPLLRDAKKVLRDIERLLGTTSNYSQHGDGRLHVEFEHVYRKDNKIADQLANEAMDGQKSWVVTTNHDENGGVGGGNGSTGKKMGKIIYV